MYLGEPFDLCEFLVNPQLSAVSSMASPPAPKVLTHDLLIKVAVKTELEVLNFSMKIVYKNKRIRDRLG